MNTAAARNVRTRNQRSTQRASVELDAAIVTMSAYQYPQLVDLSQTGARLSGASLPRPGSRALLKAGALEVLCRVIWMKDDQCGLRFEESVSPRVLKQVQLDGAVRLVEP